jgi:6-phosphogluconolactonase (cycloisomerase 2 family)
MKWIFATVAFIALLLATACGGDNSSANNSGSGNNTGVGSNPGATPGSANGGSGSSAQAGTYVYVANHGAGTISTFRLNTDGTLAATGSPVPSPGARRLATVGNKFLISSEESGSGQLHLFQISSTNGSLASNNTAVMQSPPTGLTADQGKSVVYSSTGNGIYAFAVSSSGLTSLAGSPYFTNPAGQDPRSDKQGRAVRVDASGKFLFAGFGGYRGSGLIAAIARDASGALLTEKAVVADGPESLAALWGGSILYGDNPILGFQVGSAGDLTPIAGGPVLSGQHLTSDPAGHFILATDEAISGTGHVRVFSVNQSTGIAQEVTGSPFSSGGVGPSIVRMDPSGKFAIVANGSNLVTTSPSNNLVVYRFDSSSGRLTPIGSPVTSDSLPTDVAFATVSGT